MLGFSTQAFSTEPFNGTEQSQAMGEVSSEVTSLLSLMATYHVG